MFSMLSKEFRAVADTAHGRGVPMKTFQLPIFLTVGVLIGACGKLADNTGSTSAQSGDVGFFLVNAAFVDGTTACGGYAGTTVKFDVFKEFTVPDPDNALEGDGMTYSACTRTPSEISPSDASVSLDGDAIAPAIEKTSSSAEDGARRFTALCDELNKINKGQTFKAIENFLGSKISQVPTNDQEIPLRRASLADISGPSSDLSPNDGVAVPESQAAISYCQKLYNSAKSLASLDLSQVNPPVSDLRPIKYLTGVRSLNLSGNPIHSAAAISTMALDSLEMKDVPLSGESTVFTWK
jgi:hypothetical protein